MLRELKTIIGKSSHDQSWADAHIRCFLFPVQASDSEIQIEYHKTSNINDFFIFMIGTKGYREKIYKPVIKIGHVYRENRYKLTSFNLRTYNTKQNWEKIKMKLPKTPEMTFNFAITRGISSSLIRDAQRIEDDHRFGVFCSMAV